VTPPGPPADNQSSQPDSIPGYEIAGFTVGVLTLKIAGGGHLSVNPGVLVLRIGRVTRRYAGADELRHVSPQVEVFRARATPWNSMAVVLKDDSRTVLATLPRWSRAPLLTSLRQAGFQPTEHVTWFDRGFALLRESRW
jgi:hypothetical protein